MAVQGTQTSAVASVELPFALGHVHWPHLSHPSGAFRELTFAAKTPASAAVDPNNKEESEPMTTPKSSGSAL